MAFELEARPDLEVHALADEFEQRSPTEALEWCWSEFGERAGIGTSFQGSGLVILDLCRKAGLGFPVFTIDTGLLFPETLELKNRLEGHFGIRIEGVNPQQSVEEQARTMGAELWKSRPDSCCQMRKVLPLQGKLATLDVWITGMRRQQSSTRAGIKVLELYKFDELRDKYILKLNPMARWSREQIWEYLREQRIPYNPLHDRGVREHRVLALHEAD